MSALQQELPYLCRKYKPILFCKFTALITLWHCDLINSLHTPLIIHVPFTHPVLQGHLHASCHT